MNDSTIQLNDLPDEILMMILEKLWNIRVLYSLIGINRKLDRIACDPVFTRYLQLMNGVSHNSVGQLPEIVLNRFCSDILPKIHHHIRRLDLESSTMERILSTASYPNLHQLGLFNLHAKTAASLFTSQSPLNHIDVNQIDLLTIDIKQYGDMCERSDINLLIFIHILTIFCNLKYFSFDTSQQLSFGNSPPNIFSSTLIELHVSLNDLTDCLYLLDGRFSQLHTLRVYTVRERSTQVIIDNKDKLPNLKHFSLVHRFYTDLYDNLIIPLLQRMINLEELDLYLKISRKQTVPFEHEFFLRITQAFPNVKILRLDNEQPQKKNHQDSSITRYFHLTKLHLLEVHDDYIEEFLSDSKTCLPNTVDLTIEYEAMQRVTENFTRSTTQINCSKLIRLNLYVLDDENDVNLDDIKHYFPRAKIFAKS
ncbi:unnamed protein product [Adineta steineri]|uniref:F-box domain-containing protein n=1 Tax=Adineta steineri TaxID=433720 RepID=A0A816BVW1_9BILA|nr:unnamed protein product [Adineta steineri]CAF1615085.1 unnamed protein product [Adineta steineri]